MINWNIHRLLTRAKKRESNNLLYNNNNKKKEQIVHLDKIHSYIDLIGRVSKKKRVNDNNKWRKSMTIIEIMIFLLSNNAFFTDALHQNLIKCICLVWYMILFSVCLLACMFVVGLLYSVLFTIINFVCFYLLFVYVCVFVMFFFLFLYVYKSLECQMTNHISALSIFPAFVHSFVRSSFDFELSHQLD